MALKPCRECGQEVSTEAKKCPHCGVSDPTGAIARRAKNTGCGCLLAVLIMGAIVGSVAYFGQTGGSGSSKDTLVMIGQREKFVANSFGCPTLKELNQLGSDQVANDKTGFYQHFGQYGCITVQPSDTGLNLDSSFLSGANKIRLDRDGRTYWIYTQNQELFVPVGTATGQ